MGLPNISVGKIAGTKVLDGALRSVGPSGRRMGDVEAPLGGILVPALRVALAD